MWVYTHILFGEVCVHLQRLEVNLRRNSSPFNEMVQTSFAETVPREAIHTSAAMCLRESVSLSSFYAFPKEACEHACFTQRE